MKIYWFIPTSRTDETYLGSSIEAVPITYDYLGELARTLDKKGYEGALVATGKVWEDAWVVASSLLAHTSKLKFLVAIRPGLMSPTLAARMAATFDRLSGGRLLVNVVTGGDKAELAGDGLHLEHDERYALTDEFVEVWKKTLSGETVNLDGKHVKVANAELLYRPVQQPHPPLYFGGSSEAAMQVAAKHIDVYLTWGETPEAVSGKITQMRELAALEGRQLEFGIRLHLIVRETDEEAWEAADQLIQYLDEDTIAAAQQKIRKADSVGQQRMTDLHGGDRDSLIVGPNLWSGIGLVRGGAGTALVGSPQVVAERIREYAELGITHFIFSGYPHMNEAVRVADLLFPYLPISLEAE
ncbi:alkanesulfonate monooxygenase, FMNH(2)-dependent [Paenibacillus sp. FSL H8-0548]|uniref:FMNH2-dependent alkanesulfonate monooxygenase n=1 Tax=Paenibacillus sp. FSL H8-0548 TaxID=1920422 RepID=UPI00096D0DCE|nr:FMNH2-dependent alkanesulfonate monooxygenase [Paenibacillus sp. FSL H8-0548]OMF20297.1 alkanesulfonate monooxygenase, FMNH(2)-dependent [Paenibacillus sp. FSL H8-0548]